MSDALDNFLQEINRAKLRVRRPSKFVFLCGGVILSQENAEAVNLRDYIWRIKKIGEKANHYVLAESAQQLYRDSGYGDLISFEEDIARIASVVLVISESAGSLAELGAFCSNDIISPVLRVLISEENFGKESFIRWGPVERVRLVNRDRVGVYHWIVSEDEGFRSESCEPVFDEIESFINGHVSASPETMAYPNDQEVSVFYDIMWILYLADAVTPAKLLEAVQRTHPALTQSVLKRKIYALLVAKWVMQVPFGGQDFYCLTSPSDPFQYSFHEGTIDKEPLRRVIAIRESVFGGISSGALRRVKEKRGSAQ